MIHGFWHRFSDSGTDSRILAQIRGFMNQNPVDLCEDSTLTFLHMTEFEQCHTSSSLVAIFSMRNDTFNRSPSTGKIKKNSTQAKFAEDGIVDGVSVVMQFSLLSESQRRVRKLTNRPYPYSLPVNWPVKLSRENVSLLEQPRVVGVKPCGTRYLQSLYSTGSSLCRRKKILATSSSSRMQSDATALKSLNVESLTGFLLLRLS